MRRPATYLPSWPAVFPTARTKIDVHIFDGTTYTLTVSWLRFRTTFSYHTPRHSRKVRKIRAANAARNRARVNAELARHGAHHLIED